MPGSSLVEGQKEDGAPDLTAYRPRVHPTPLSGCVFWRKNDVHSVDVALWTRSTGSKGRLTNPTDIPSLTLSTQLQNSLVLMLCPKPRNPSVQLWMLQCHNLTLGKGLSLCAALCPTDACAREGSLCTSKPFG